MTAPDTPRPDSCDTLAPVFPGTTRLRLTSARTGQAHILQIAEPEGPAPAEGWPLIVSLDGNALFATFTETLRLQARFSPGREPALLVALGYEGDEPFPKPDRFRDFTPPADPQALLARSSGAPWPASGGAAAFIAALREEILPLIAARWPVDPARRALFGHSLSGLLALQVLRDHPRIFASYIIGSPSLWWPGVDGMSLDSAGWSAALEGGGCPRVHLGVGGEETPEMRRLYAELAQTFAALPEGRMALTAEEVAGEEHVSVLPSLIARAVGVAQAPRDRAGG
ncbi:alpha/beta hydrolase [Pseudoroseicyclus sp. CXY001]|uniref:alpha/beta hydrolase n=1 Tax=Pseudoroseicyclus sp. CXY001 TaxID=3242492 RepID=UPI00358DA4ED